MATLLRSAKSGSHWGTHELLAFNIVIVDVDAQTFFGGAGLPERPTVSDTIWNNEQEPKVSVEKSDLDFFLYLEDAMMNPPAAESAVGDFTAFILKMMHYDEGLRVIHLQKEMGFEMCGQRVDAKTDVCVIDRSNRAMKYLLVVQEDKRHLSKYDPEPQLIAEAVAAFYENNRARRQMRLPKLQAQIIPGITMVGTTPIFFKIHVTEELLFHLATSQYPPEQTVVERFVPPVLSPQTCLHDGMKVLVNRRIYLRCFEAFRQFVN